LGWRLLFTQGRYNKDLKGQKMTPTTTTFAYLQQMSLLWIANEK